MSETNQPRQNLSINETSIPGQVGQAGHTLNQVQGNNNVINSIQGKDIKVINLTVYDSVPERLRPLPITNVRSLNKTDDRLRKVLLNKVKNYWVQDVLEKSLHTKVLIELGIEKHLDAVKDPFDNLQAIPEAVKRSPLPTTDVSEVFDGLGDGRTLLILGEPGSGKTITLLKLAKDLIARTEQDMSQPIPIVLNLSSWAIRQLPISDWLVEELSNKYQVSKDLGMAWVNSQQLLLLLDGFDEVRADCQGSCLQALNQFVQAHGQTEMVVCSRLRDYERLASTAPLQLQVAIYIRPLTPEQVVGYLDKAGDSLKALRIVLQTDEALQELATSPLMLSVMSLAYQHKALEDIPLPNSGEEHRRILFDTYIQQAFRRRGRANRGYSEAKMRHWLVKLAQRMTQDSLSIFLIERMQPAWLGPGKVRLLYRVGLVLVGGVTGGLVFGLTGSLSGGLSCNADGSLVWNSADGLAWGLVLTWVGAGIGGLMVSVGKEDIKPMETFEVSWTALMRSLISRQTLTKGFVGAVIGALGLGLCAWLTSYLVQEGILLGLCWGFMFGIVLGISSALTGSEIETKTIPNQGIWRSALNAVWIGLSFGLLTALLGELGFTLMNLNNTCKILTGLLILLGFGGLGIVVNTAGKACLRHFTLRLVLFSQDFIPWNYSRFLDSAVEYIFLQRAGGSYFFIHRTLMEHFAGMEIIKR